MRFFLFAVFLLAWAEAKHQRHLHQNCFSGDKVQDGMVPTQVLSRIARQTPVQLVPTVEKEHTRRQRQRRHHEHSCPTLRPQDSVLSEVRKRSISPWRHRINEDETRYPSKLAFAECLCNGCIDSKTGQETASLVSVLVHQNVMVVRRKPCSLNSHASGFTFEIEYINVPVACTCALPLSKN